MERDEALFEELGKNADAIVEFQSIAQKQQSTMWNIDEFSKKMSVNVMVPICRKAHVPGTLVHTGEVLVAHSEDLFSQCTAYQAKEICNLRLHKTTEMLSKLEQERKLLMDKLSKPMELGAFAGPGEQEIMDEYTEELAKRRITKRQPAKTNQESPTLDMVEEFRREVLQGEVIDFEGTDISLEALQTILKEERQAASNGETFLDFLEGDAKKDPTDEELFETLAKLGCQEAEANEMAALQKAPSDPEAPEILRKLMAGEIKPRYLKQRVARKASETSTKLDGGPKAGTGAVSIAAPNIAENVIKEIRGQKNDLEPPTPDENACQGHCKKRVHFNEANKMPLQELNLQDNAMEERNKRQQEIASTPQNEPRRRVSFSSAQETLEFVRSEKVTDMRWRTPMKEFAKVEGKVTEKVDDNCSYIYVNHSNHRGIKTSGVECQKDEPKTHKFTPGTPADFYDGYLKLRGIKMREKYDAKEDEQAKVTLNKEAERDENPATENPRPTKAERKKLAQPKSPVEPKPILRNKNIDKIYESSAYFQTVGDVAERKLKDDPESEEKFKRKETKKRTSRFSKMRHGADKSKP